MSKLDEINELGFLQLVYDDVSSRIVCMKKEQKDWLVSEIKQLKEEKEWLINKVQRISNVLAGHNENYVRQELLKEMQQALKEE